MDSDKELGFLPFHAINEFMLDEYRLKVIQTVLTSLDLLPDKHSRTINNLMRKHVKIAGFRNSLKAPIGLKLKQLGKAFEKSPEIVAAIISAWADINFDLKQKVYEMLENRDWDLLPIEADRTKLPGFLTSWPSEDNFDSLYECFNQMFPHNPSEKNDVSLMVVWICGRLPYKFNENTPNDP